MATQSSQRSRRNASPSSSTKPQPMRATMPFSLSTKRSSSPPKGAYLRRSSPASSPVHINEGPFRTTRRSSPEIRTSPENRRSPTSPNLLSYRVERPKSSGQSFGRTSSLDALYMSSQWPRSEISGGFPAPIVGKETQTSSDEHNSITMVEQTKHQRSASWGSPDVNKKFRQNLQRSKQSSQLYGRQSPIAADHTAIAYSSSIPIPVMAKTHYHGRSSMEGLNSEVEGLVITDGEDSVFKSPPEQPDGHRAPLPRGLSCSIDAVTQTRGEMFHQHDNHTVMVDHACQTKSPTAIVRDTRAPLHTGVGRESCSPDAPTGFKYASSPKPNNSYLFAREPPDGAEKVTLHFDDFAEKAKWSKCPSGPDKSKGTIKFSQQSPFHFINPLPSKVAPPSTEHSCIH